jgi:hypothetical protein
MQDDQINWLKTMQATGMHIMWKEADECHAVVGFSTPRPHIIFVAKGDVTSRHPKDKNAIIEMDARQMYISDFIILNKIEVPNHLRDPICMSI